MSYFLSPKKITEGNICSFSRDEAGHILLSRRLKIGERFHLQDPVGERYLVELVAVDKRSLSVKPLEQVLVPQELPYRLVLYQAYVAEKALDIILQKATELGVAEIVLYNAKNTASRLRAEQFSQKAMRWNKILWEAAKQCDRGRVPILNFQETTEQALRHSAQCDYMVVLNASGKRLDPELFNGKIANVGVVVGPEGGFTADELQTMMNLKNTVCISVAPFMLRDRKPVEPTHCRR